MTSCLQGWVTFTPAEPSARVRASSVADVASGGSPSYVEVQPRVGAVQAELARLALVQGGRQRRADAGADQPGPDPALVGRSCGVLTGSSFVTCTG